MAGYGLRGAEITAVICTRNRAGDLRRCLENLGRQTLPAGRFEVIVVDNGSTDETREVAETARLPGGVQYLHEPTIGLSRARNAGWRCARGGAVAYLDDDAVAAPDWLERMLGRFRSARPRPAALGGRVSLLWGTPRPDWVTRDMAAHLGLVDWDFGPGPLPQGRGYLAGTNVAFAREALEEIGGFDTNLGRKGSLLLSNEEILVQWELHRRHRCVYYDPAIIVGHVVRPERLHPQWFYRRYYWQGVSDAVLRRRHALGGEGHRSRSLSVAGDLAAFGLALLRAIGPRLAHPRRRVATLCRIHEGLGRLAGDLGIAFHGPETG